jgi:2-keto-3-deoxy-L-rhamnonate aldolase RhmA
MVIVQFESAECLVKADEISAVEGVDVVLVGLNDMLADMGLPASTTIRRCASYHRHRCLPQARQALRRRRALQRPT